VTPGGAKEPSWLDRIEETLLAILLGLMTIITFANVMARYVFDSNILWALEATVYLFAWMVLLGASYCVKINAHLGVDVIVKMVGPGARKVLTMLTVACCLLFAGLLLVGSWNYWAPFAGYPPVPNIYNSWIAGPLGLGEIENQWRDQAWYEVNDIPMGEWLRFIEGPFNQGESYDYIPKFIPYLILPISMTLLLFRFAQAALRISRNEQELMVASHEVEDEIEEAALRAAGEKQ